MREFDGKHQSIRLNHWHQSFFRILQIESSRCESHSHTDINSQCPPLLKDSMHSFSGHFFHSVGRIHFESAIPRDTIHYSSIISQHSVSENKSVPLLYTSILEPLCCSFTPPLPYILVLSPCFACLLLTLAPPRSLILHPGVVVWCNYFSRF